jgi:hypothetical protein
MKHIKLFEEFGKYPKRNAPETALKEETYYIVPSYVQTSDEFDLEIKIVPGDVVYIESLHIGGGGGVSFEINGGNDHDSLLTVPISDFEEFLVNDVDNDQLVPISGVELRRRAKAAGVEEFGEVSEDVAKERLHDIEIADKS